MQCLVYYRHLKKLLNKGININLLFQFSSSSQRSDKLDHVCAGWDGGEIQAYWECSMRSDLGFLNKDNITRMEIGNRWLRWSVLGGWGVRAEEVLINDGNEALCNINRGEKAENLKF